MGVLVTQLFNGLSLGSILLLVALGLALTFGQMGVINMAHGEFIMAGAYTAYVVQTRSSAAPACRCSSSLPVAFVVAGLLGVLLEVTLIRRHVRPSAGHAAGDLGCRAVLQQLARDVFGAAGVNVPAPAWLSGPRRGPRVRLPASHGCSSWCWRSRRSRRWPPACRFTSLGRRIRASCRTATSPRAPASPPGPRTGSRSSSAPAWPGVAGVALTLIGLDRRRTWAPSYIIDAFLVVVVGGLGQIKGAVIAAFVLGIVNSVHRVHDHGLARQVIVFVLIVVFLQVRPQGIYQLKTRSLA